MIKIFISILLIFTNSVLFSQNIKESIINFNLKVVNIEPNERYFNYAKIISVDSLHQINMKSTLIYYDSIHYDSNALQIKILNNKMYWHYYPKGILSNISINYLTNNISNRYNEYLKTKSYPPFIVLKKGKLIFYKPIYTKQKQNYNLNTQSYKRKLMYNKSNLDTIATYILEDIFKKSKNDKYSPNIYSSYLKDTIINYHYQDYLCDVFLLIENNAIFDLPNKINTIIYFEKSTYIPLKIIKYIYKENSYYDFNNKKIERFNLINIEYFFPE